MIDIEYVCYINREGPEYEKICYATEYDEIDVDIDSAKVEGDKVIVDFSGVCGGRCMCNIDGRVTYTIRDGVMYEDWDLDEGTVGFSTKMRFRDVAIDLYNKSE